MATSSSRWPPPGCTRNGYSLARHVLLERAGWSLDRHVPELGRTLGEELLEPTRIYTLDVLDLIGAGGIHAVSHITGGGIAANVARVLPVGLHAQIDRPTWTPPPIFGLIGELGGVSLLERERTFNEGLGMVAVVDPDHAAAGLRRLAARGVPAWVCGHVRTAQAGDASDAAAKGGTGGTVTLVGEHS